MLKGRLYIDSTRYRTVTKAALFRPMWNLFLIDGAFYLLPSLPDKPGTWMWCLSFQPTGSRAPQLQSHGTPLLTQFHKFTHYNRLCQGIHETNVMIWCLMERWLRITYFASQT